MAGMVCGLALNVYCGGSRRIPFTWYVVFGTVATFVVGYGASRVAGGTSGGGDAADIASGRR